MVAVRVRLDYLRALTAHTAVQLLGPCLVCLSFGLLVAVQGDILQQVRPGAHGMPEHR